MADAGGNADEMLLCKGTAVAGLRGFHKPKGQAYLAGNGTLRLALQMFWFGLQVNKVMNSFF